MRGGGGSVPADPITELVDWQIRQGISRGQYQPHRPPSARISPDPSPTQNDRQTGFTSLRAAFTAFRDAAARLATAMETLNTALKKDPAMECTTSKGHTIRVGQLYRDHPARSATRTLRVDTIGPRLDRHDMSDDDRAITYTVIREEYQGAVTEPMRTNSMTAKRLTSPVFVPVPEPDRA